MPGLSCLPDDLLLEILLHIHSPRHLHSTILSCRSFFRVYSRRKSLIIRSLFQDPAEHLHRKDILIRASKLVHNARTNIPTKAIMIYEAIQPLMLTGIASISVCTWAVKLYHFYQHPSSDPPNTDKILPILTWIYQNSFSHYPLITDLSAPFPIQARLLQARGKSRLSSPRKDVLKKLQHHYRTHADQPAALELEKAILFRLDPKETDYFPMTLDLASSYRHLPARHDEALAFYHRMYEFHRTHGFWDTALGWARHVVRESERAGDDNGALATLRVVLGHFGARGAGYVAWGRRLIAALRGAGRGEEALGVRRALWGQMGPESVWYYGWGRELADDYRRLGRMGEARAVFGVMLGVAEAASARRPRDRLKAYHKRAALRSMLIIDPTFVAREGSIV